MSVYKAPGVYIQENTSPSFANLSTSAMTVGIVGTAPNWYIATNQPNTKGSGATDTIPNSTISFVLSVIGIGDAPNVYNYTAATDYTITNNVITWVGAHIPATGATYYITFQNIKTSDFYQPITFFDIGDVRANYAPELYGGIFNPLTYAANMAFQGNASQIVAVQANSGSVNDIKSAIDMLRTENINALIVTGCTNTIIQQYIKEHVDLMSSDLNRMERDAYVCPINLNDPIVTIASEAEALADQRMKMIAPPGMDVVIHDSLSNTDVTMTLPTIYAGAYLAGVRCSPSTPIAQPLTRQNVPVISGLETGITGKKKYIETEKNYLAGNGVMVIEEPVAGSFRVRHARTTDTTNVNRAEESVVAIKDYIRRTLRADIDKSFVGSEIIVGKATQVASHIEGFLTGEINHSITAYRNVKAIQDQTDPTQIDVTMELSVVYPLNFVNISFTLYI